MRYRFGDFELDTEAYALTRSGQPLHLRPKVFEVLRFLIERRGRVVAKQELMDALWDVEHLSAGVVHWTVNHARRALGQKGHDKQPIETVYSRGYRWRVEVEVVDDGPVEHPRPDAAVDTQREFDALPFVGRSELMADLRQRLALAKAGRGGLCVLVGEPGIGKTRCMDELALSVCNEGFSAWSGRATEDRWAPPFWPWTQVLRAAAAGSVDADLARRLLTQLSPAGTDRGERAARSDDDAPQPANFMLVDSIGRFLLQASRNRPLLVLLDDLHWADAASIDLLAAIAPELRRHAVLIIASQRDRLDGYRVRPSPQLARYVERIQLQPLTTHDVDQYIRLVTRCSPPGAALCAAVHSATAGNALFLQETVRALIALHGASGLSSLSSADVKPGQLARDVLRERLAGLDPRTLAVLSTASVLGESFDADLLQKVSGVALDALLAALDVGERVGLLEAQGASRYRFCHALVRSVLYDELPAHARITAHRAAAVAVEGLAHIFPRPRELAHHYYRSLALGQAGAVAAAAQRAAEDAIRTGEFEDAAMFCQWALESQALDLDTTPRQRGELLLLRALSERHAGRGRDARTSVAQLVDFASAHGIADLLVRAARVLRPGRTWTAFADPVVRAALEEVLRITPDESDENRISALSQLASVPPYALDMQRSKALSATALALARKRDSRTLLAEALRARLYALSGPDDIDAMLAVAQEMLVLDGDAASRISIAAHSACYSAAIHRGDLAGANHALEELGRTARMQHRPEALWYHDRLKAQRRFLEGDFAGAEAAFADLQNMRVSSPWMPLVPQVLTALERQDALAMAAQWDLPTLVSRANEMPAEYGAAMARVAVNLDRIDLARPLFEDLCRHDFEHIPKDIGYLNTLANLSLVAIALHDRTRAELLYERLAPYPQHNSPNRLLYYEGCVSHHLALLAEFLGADERVPVHFDNALAVNESLGHKTQLARTYYEYARFVLRDGVAHERGRQLQQAAARIAEALGMSALQAQISAL